MFAKLKDVILKLMTDFLISRGYYVAKPHFYNPIPDKKYLLENDGYWKYPYPMYGVEFYDNEQISLCEQISQFAPEINHLPEDIFNPEKNRSFLDMDLEFLYCMILFVKPKRYIEIGAGFTSLIAIQALQRNRGEGFQCHHTIIEPYPVSYFLESFKKADRFFKKPVQEISADLFKDLSVNDILFIDTSHVAKYGSDVNYLYFHLVPLVGHGSYIHMHDIFIPMDYCAGWIFDHDKYWNEQYIVMAFLMYNKEYKIRIAAQYLSRKYRDKLNNLFPRFLPSFSPGSLWLQRI